MARTQTTKADQDRAAREAKAAAAEKSQTGEQPESGAALPGGVTVKRDGKPVAPAEQKEEAKKNTAKAASKVNDVTIEEVDELPKVTREHRDMGPSPWALRLKAVQESKKGRAKIYTCNSTGTANGTAYRVRKALKAGRYTDVLGPDADKHFRVVISGSDIYAEHIRPA
jgi:hypothetical protein